MSMVMLIPLPQSANSKIKINVPALNIAVWRNRAAVYKEEGDRPLQTFTLYNMTIQFSCPHFDNLSHNEVQYNDFDPFPCRPGACKSYRSRRPAQLWRREQLRAKASPALLTQLVRVAWSTKRNSCWKTSSPPGMRTRRNLLRGQEPMMFLLTALTMADWFPPIVGSVTLTSLIFTDAC